MTTTPAAILAEHAAQCLDFERTGQFTQEAARHASRAMLTGIARELGISETEIEAAVDAALAGNTRST